MFDLTVKKKKKKKKTPEDFEQLSDAAAPVAEEEPAAPTAAPAVAAAVDEAAEPDLVGCIYVSRINTLLLWFVPISFYIFKPGNRRGTDQSSQEAVALNRKFSFAVWRLSYRHPNKACSEDRLFFYSDFGGKSIECRDVYAGLWKWELAVHKCALLPHWWVK